MSSKLIFVFLILIISLHVLIFTKLIYFPYPELFINPYLTNHGLKPYSQILDQHFPGLMFLPVNLNNLGMTTVETARVWSISIVILIQLMLFFVGSKILKSKTKAILVNILYLIWQPFFEGWVLWIESFLPLLLLPASYALYKKKFFVTGILLGLAVVVKQTIVPLSALVLIYTFWTERSFKYSLNFLFGLIIPISLMVIYLVSIGVFKDFWYWTIVYNLSTYAQSGTKAPPSIGYISRIVIIYGASLFALLDRKKSIVFILLIFVAGALIGALERADFVRLQSSLPFVILATVYGCGKLGKFGKWGGLGIKIGYLAALVWWLNIFYKGHLGNRVIAFDPDTQELAVKIRNYTSPREKIFVYGAAPQLYQMSGTLPAGNIFVFQFPWFMQVAENRILEGIKKDQPEIVISDESVVIEGAKIVDFARDIDQYIQSNYQKIDSVGTAEILQRK